MEGIVVEDLLVETLSTTGETVADATAATVDRRRPGRADNVSGQLVRLLRFRGDTSAALPETKVRLFKISSFGADPMKEGGRIAGKPGDSGATAQ